MTPSLLEKDKEQMDEICIGEVGQYLQNYKYSFFLFFLREELNRNVPVYLHEKDINS